MIPPGAKALGDGFYATADGTMHIDFDEFILAAGGDPASERDRATAQRAIDRIMGELAIPVEVREE